MSNFATHEARRSVVFATSIRFSPHTQPIKQTALDMIVSQVIYSIDDGQGVYLQDIEKEYSRATSGYSITNSDLAEALDRVAQKIIKPIVSDISTTVYKLHPERVEIIEKARSRAEANYNKVISQLFENVVEDNFVYKEPFLFCVSVLASHLGDEIVLGIHSEYKEDTHTTITSVVKNACNKFPDLDPKILLNALTKFIQSDELEYKELMWNTVQNLYVAKSLGLDPTGKLLSENIFKDAIFLLDTNILIAALGETSKFHHSFSTLSRACSRLGIDLQTCQISLDEMQNWTEYQYDLIEKVIAQIPEELAPRVDSLFFNSASKVQDEDGNVNLATIFEQFHNASQNLKQKYNIEVIDDNWFDSARNQPDVQRLTVNLQRKYEELRNRPKKFEAAIHDAVLLTWALKQKKKYSRKIWLVTLDTTLSQNIVDTTSAATFVVTLGALLHWITPVLDIEDEKEGFIRVFAEMIKIRFLPQERFFSLEDFRIFAEMNMQCRNLPAQDVEDCINYLQTNVPNLNPSNPKHREQLAYNVQKFFADPSRRFVKEIDNYKGMLGKAEAKVQDTITEYEKMLVDRDLRHMMDIKARDQRIAQLEQKFDQFEAISRNDQVKRKAEVRLLIVLVIWIIALILITYAALTLGEGKTAFSKLTNTIEVYLLVTGLCVAFAWIFVGIESIKKLGKDFAKLLGIDK